MGNLESQMKRLEDLKFGEILSKRTLKMPAEQLRQEIRTVIEVLSKKKRDLSCPRPDPSTLPPQGMSAFKNVAGVVVNADGSNVGVIDAKLLPARGNGGRQSKHSQLRRAAYEELKMRLKEKNAYDPILLDDEACGIASTIDSRDDRARQRSEFRKLLINSAFPFPVGIHAQQNSGPHPSCISLFRLPRDYNRSLSHSGQFAVAIQTCEADAPKFISSQDRKNFNRIISSMAGNMPEYKLSALRRTLLGDESTSSSNEDRAKELFDFCLQVSAGEDVDQLFYDDFRELNSRGGEGIGTTHFQDFIKTAEGILHSNVELGAEERRRASSDDTVYASTIVSIPDLMRKTIAQLQREVAAGDRHEMPKIPSCEWLRLQFSANNDFAATAAKHSGSLQVSRKIQSRTLRKEHPDQHWVNSYTRYHLEWLIRANTAWPGSVLFYGQDDKARIPVGNDVAVSTNVRSRNGAIVPLGTQPKKFWDEQAVNRAYDATTNFNVGDVGMVPANKWLTSTYHFPIIAEIYNVHIVLYDVEQTTTSLWTPGDDNAAYYHGVEKGLHALDGYLGRSCIRLIFHAMHYRYLAPYSITETE